VRAKVLALLRRKAGGFVSGEDICHELGISRTAVWKHIQSLREEGYIIDAHFRLGYRFRKAPDILLPEELLPRLRTKVLGQSIHYFPSIGSTNDEAKRLAAAGCPEGTVVIAEVQEAGRGRLSRGWFSPPGKGITMSVVLRPAIPPREAPRCTLAAAVAVHRAISQFAGVACGIKWPNDILDKQSGRKLVGILTEMSAEIDAVNYIVVGIGINVNSTQEDFPPEIAGIAASLAMISGQPFCRPELVAALLDELEQAYFKITNDRFAEILAAWREASLTLGAEVAVFEPGGSGFTGMARDIDAEGALLVETPQGMRRVVAGDVTLRPARLGK